jgi:hypothetical protein
MRGCNVCNACRDHDISGRLQVRHHPCSRLSAQSAEFPTNCYPYLRQLPRTRRMRNLLKTLREVKHEVHSPQGYASLRIADLDQHLRVFHMDQMDQ